MNSFLTVMSMGGCQGSKRETQQCGCECLVPSFAGKHRDQGLLQSEGRRLLAATHLYQQQISIFLSRKMKVCEQIELVYIYSCTYFYIKTRLFVPSHCFKQRPRTNIYITFVLLQQLVVELHHLLVLFELQQALAQIESQRKTHFLQRLPVLGLLLHLHREHTERTGWVVEEAMVAAVMDGRGNAEKMKQE